MTRMIVVLAIAVTLSVGGAIGLAQQEPSRGLTAPPFVADTTTGLGAADLEDVVAGLQARLDEVPGDAPGWATLALAYVEQARISGAAELYGRASEAVERSLEEQPQDNAGALAARASIAAARHDFAGALRSARQALAIDPFHPTALVVRVDALTELGRYDAQLRALRQADRRQPGLPVVTRYSYAFELRGQLLRASALLGSAGATATAADRAFVLTLLADLDRRRGRLAQAAAHLRTALQAVPDYVPAMVSRARLTVAQGDLAAAVRQWKDVTRRVPIPEYVTELGELRLFLGQSSAAATDFSVVSTTNELLSRDGVNTDLESALFEADHGTPATALTAARAEWDRRRSVHVADVLAWALHQNGRHREALRYARLATRLGTADPRFWLHRGAIEAELGLDVAARRHLSRGLRADPGQSPWQAEQARDVLRRLGDRS